MLRQRYIVGAILTPTAFLVIYLGGYIYEGAIFLLLVISAWEYIKLQQKINLKPAVPVVIGGVIILILSRIFFRFNYNSVLITLLLFGSAAFYIIQNERGIGTPALDFGGTLAIIFYIGFLGPYLISLRDLPDGMWWTFLVLPIVWIADSCAFLIGTAFGKRKLAPKTSPNKTWEGYLSGVFGGVLAGIGLSVLFVNTFNAGINLNPAQGAILGFLISALIPLGDLTESMIKRQAGVKDSGVLFPGHGGAFDRIDSLFWAAPIGYYLILHTLL